MSGTSPTQLSAAKHATELFVSYNRRLFLSYETIQYILLLSQSVKVDTVPVLIFKATCNGVSLAPLKVPIAMPLRVAD